MKLFDDHRTSRGKSRPTSSSHTGTYECAICGEPIWMDQKEFQWRGVVVEPNPTTFERLAQNYANASERVSAVNAAVCGENGPATLYVDAAHPTAETASIDKRDFEADPSAFSQARSRRQNSSVLR